MSGRKELGHVCEGKAVGKEKGDSSMKVLESLDFILILLSLSWVRSP